MQHFVYYIFTITTLALFYQPVLSFSQYILPRACHPPVRPYLIKDGAVFLYSANNQNKVYLLTYCFIQKRIIRTDQFLDSVNSSVSILREDGKVNMCHIHCRAGFVPYPKSLTGYQNLDIGCSSIGNVQCRRPYCSIEPSFVFNGEVECTDGRYDDSFCVLTCNDGYRSVGNTFKHCVDGSWQPAEQWGCEEIKCNPTPKVRNGVLACSGDKIFSECQVLCNRGYFAKGPQIGVCLDMGEEFGDWRWMGHNSTEATTETFLDCTQLVKPTVGQTNRTLTVNQTDVNELLLLLYISGSTPNPETPQTTKTTTTSTPITAVVPINTNYTIFKKRFDACDVNLSARIGCGPDRVTRLECESLSCCWDDSVSPHLASICFRRSANIVNQARKRPSPGFRHIINPFVPPLNGPQILTTTGLSPCSRIMSSSSDIRNIETPVHPLCEACGCRSDTVGRGCVSNAAPLLNDDIISERVICGSPSKAIDWPWNVLIYINDRLFCGGTLIAAQYVLTAGHCLPPLDNSFGSSTFGGVLLGISNSSTYTDNNQYRKILTFQRHPNFTLGNGAGYIMNDIAIIKLATPVTITSTVRPLCMPYFREPMLGNDECHVSGFGKTTMYGPNKISETLQSAQLPLVRLSTCVRYYPGMATNGENICAGSNLPNTADTCSGDSGGPLACKKKGENCWYLAGITSYGRTPCGQGIPSVYVNVRNYQNWIFATVSNMVSYLG